MIKIKQINCVNCPKLCQKEDLSKLKSWLDKLKAQGYDEVEFKCQAGRQIIENFNK